MLVPIGFRGHRRWGWRLLMPSHSVIPDGSPIVQINIKHLIDDVESYEDHSRVVLAG